MSGVKQAVVAFSLLAKFGGENLTIHFPPALKVEISSLVMQALQPQHTQSHQGLCTGSVAMWVRH